MGSFVVDILGYEVQALVLFHFWDDFVLMGLVEEVLDHQGLFLVGLGVHALGVVVGDRELEKLILAI